MKKGHFLLFYHQFFYLIDEAREAVVEALDLLLLVGSAHGQVGVDLQVQGGQQALVDRQGRQRGPQTLMVAVGAGVQGAAAQGDAAEAPRPRAETAHPPGAAAAPDRAAGADPLGSAQTHGAVVMRRRKRRGKQIKMRKVQS